ncbi:hypothetical protein ACU686_41500 [Yinghuangia aomiensis]
MSAIERGYGDDVSEYTNDLYCRNWLHDAWLLLDEHVVRLWTPWIKALDAQYKAATIDDDGQALGQFTSCLARTCGGGGATRASSPEDLGRSLRSAAPSAPTRTRHDSAASWDYGTALSLGRWSWLPGFSRDHLRYPSPSVVGILLHADERVLPASPVKRPCFRSPKQVRHAVQSVMVDEYGFRRRRRFGAR